MYSGGLSEQAIGDFIKGKRDRFFVASKCGRQLSPHVQEAYTPAILRKFVEDSLKRLNTDYLDLIQLHCPPTEVYYRPEIFGLFDDLKKEGKIRHLGVSVEKVEEGLKAIAYENVVSVQIIFNMFRQRPAELFFKECERKKIAIIARVPLASGLLSGKFNSQSTFGENDHRFFNRNGEAFDKGETFSGIPYATALEAVDELKTLIGSENLALKALRWILMFQQVSVVIPGASSAQQVSENMRAGSIPAFTPDTMLKIEELYLKYFKTNIHHMW